MTSADKFIAFLIENTFLRQVRLESEHYRDVTRYAWGEPRPYELALSLGKNRRHGRPNLLDQRARFAKGS